MVKCPAIKHKPPVNMGDLVQDYADSLDQYFECASRHNALVDFEVRKK